MGVKITLFTGMVFNPSYQERTYAIQDLIYQQDSKYEPNFEYSNKWQQTFKLKKEK